ncbi:hypothetical protein A5742_17410 [Mycolicibacterium fortuitum]|uniref:Uncharacterized protein n=1 Tax=Mycolicibacterium fortuitum TaxID=1766 RepID=A0ABD6QU30_MYCFO|nr:hypothetical protein A5742_17410 [Mycolicibacterium fortuitum]
MDLRRKPLGLRGQPVGTLQKSLEFVTKLITRHPRVSWILPRPRIDRFTQLTTHGTPLMHTQALGNMVSPTNRA